MRRISIIMSVYNEKPLFLKKSIESMLSQDFTDFEFLIINDGSTEETSGILKDYAQNDTRVVLMQNDSNLGLTKSLNIGIKKSQGEFIARMDSDDISLSNRLTDQLNFLLKNKLDLMGADCAIIDEHEKILKNKRISIPADIKKSLFKGNFFTHSTFFGKRMVFEELYNENFRRSQDYEFLLRIAGKGYKLGYMNKIALKYRVNMQGISVKQAKEQEYFALKARFLALSKYGYSYLLLPHIIRPIVSLMLPYKLKSFIVYKLLQ